MSRPLVVGVVLAVLAGVLALPLPGSRARASAGGHSSTERQVVGLINAMRAQHGLGPLWANRRLSRAADDHSRDMLRKNFLAHASSDGTSFNTRLHRYVRAAEMGENIGYVTGRSGAAVRIVRMWMGSAGHRSMILKPSFGRIGVGARNGRLGRERLIFITADFASR